MTDTASMIANIADLQLKMMRGTGLDRRGQHPKQHGCVKAKFTGRADIPEQYKVGLFKTPATYEAYIRFSNGKWHNDIKGDVHGMAIKLTGVSGERALDSEAETETDTQDFILVDHPVFFIRDTAEYEAFTESLADDSALPTSPMPPLQKFMGWLKANRQEAEFKRTLSLLGAFKAGHKPSSPLETKYWSQVPYAFGRNLICRYMAKPVSPGGVTAPSEDTKTSDYLLRAMIDHLASRPARFEFAVQMHDRTPEVIDDPTVEWNEGEHPFQIVADIDIPAQTFDTPEQRRFGENLSFTPWHALSEHRPVGQINEIRRNVYLKSSDVRHEQFKP